MKTIQIMAGAEHGGAETAYLDLCIALKEAGEDVIAVTRPNARNAELTLAHIPVYELKFGGALDIWTTLELKTILKSSGADLAMTWMSRAAAKTPRVAGIPLVARLGGYYKLKNYKNTDAFVGNTPDICRYIIDQGVVPSRVRHINNFARTAPHQHAVKRRDLDTPDDATVLLSLGRLHEAKAIDVAIDALKDLPDAYYWIAGEGELRLELEDRAKKNGVLDRVRFLGWRTDREALLEAADICVFCSRFEPFGAVFVQAWAAKTPVIVSDADGPAQYVRDHEDTLVVPKNNPAAIVQAVRELQANPALCQYLITNGYARYQAEFTKEQTIKAYLDFYQQVLAEYKTVAPSKAQAA